MTHERSTQKNGVKKKKKKRVAHWYVVMTGNMVADGNEMIANYLDAQGRGKYENQFPELEIKRKNGHVRIYNAWETESLFEAQQMRSDGNNFGYSMFIARKYEGSQYAEEWIFTTKRRSPSVKKIKQQIEDLKNL